MAVNSALQGQLSFHFFFNDTLLKKKSYEKLYLSDDALRQNNEQFKEEGVALISQRANQ